MMKIEGKVAVVLGGARSIGAAYCEALLQHGAKLCIADILDAEGENTRDELRKKYSTDNVIFCKCDVRVKEDIQNVFQKTKHQFGTVEIAIYNVGIMDEVEWEFCVDINLNGIIRFAYIALEEMGKNKSGKGGVVINTASVSGMRPEFWGPVYSATKSGVIHFIRSIALPEWYEKHRIRFNCICPTTVKSYMADTGREGNLNMHFNEIFTEGLQNNQDMCIPASKVAEAMLMGVEDESLNGAAILVTKAEGIKVHQFHDIPADFQ